MATDPEHLGNDEKDGNDEKPPEPDNTPSGTGDPDLLLNVCLSATMWSVPEGLLASWIRFCGSFEVRGKLSTGDVSEACSSIALEWFAMTGPPSGSETHDPRHHWCAIGTGGQPLHASSGS